ncbi:MAG: transcription-repair coupling factor [Sedimentisphaerales bacterium]|nr:transcription-repair coupling factor [Sedimentisphaerales bacterium]
MNIGNDKIVKEIASQLKKSSGKKDCIKIEGTWGSFGRLLVSDISKETNRPILYICSHIDDADKALDDINTFLTQNLKILDCDSPTKCRLELLSAWEGEEDLADATDEIRAERLRLVSRLSEDKFIIPASVQALCQPVPSPKDIESGSLILQVDKQVPPEDVVKWLVDNGFERTERVDLPGQFSQRGGIIDIYAPLANRESNENTQEQQGIDAIRIEFFGDTIESIRQIDLDTQRSNVQIKNIKIVSAICGTGSGQKELFLNILPKDTIIVFEEPNDIEEVAKVFLTRAENPERLYNWEDIYNSASNFTQLHICRFATSQPEDFIKVDIKSVQQYQHKATSIWAGHKAALEELLKEAKHGKKVMFYCESAAEQKRVTEIIKEINREIPEKFQILLGFIHQGFVINSINTIVISHHELFGQFTMRQRRRPARATMPVDSLSDLHRGDYVVHASYGIGKYLGIEAITEKNEAGIEGINEYLTIEYSDKEKIQVSVRNIALVQKFIGTSPSRPALSKVGSKKWLKQKEKVTRSIQDLAAELLEVQAKRQSEGGITFAKDSKWQIEFEESFPYQETPDQTIAIEQIKNDMHQPIVMDRLLCGDVGYGKTEIAMRAAFKAVENGKQVAILTPTTVLSVQHGRTFTERFADFPIWIEVLNRFKTARQAKEIIEKTREGKVDILIGTHRLFSGDIGFKDLGLLIIDEEQRFGVTHKEKLKKLRVNVDILTLTATPIPRTLHMSLLGLRDISSLGTPPLDRRSIVTSVTAYNNQLITKVINRELNRQGQVFFLHNRVQSIDKKAWEIRKLVPEAKIGIAHGQMTKSELEKAMVDFVTGKIDVLVCTTIIESGLDIPNANTILINDADRFGLAELHQLRGRVGRYKHRAYAYMLLPMSRPITPIAAKRLKAIEEYSHLGAGFRIALRDLEIRGAGNILGPEQSGHIQTVGYQMYCELLADAVRKMKNEPVEPIPHATIDLGFAMFIPKNYIPIDRQRMDAYRRIAVTRNSENLQQIRDEFADVYGPIPEEVNLLLELAELRIMASKRKIKGIVTYNLNLIFSFENNYKNSDLKMFDNISGKIRIRDEKTIYLQLTKNYFEPRTLIMVLRKILEEKNERGKQRKTLS